MQGKPPPHNYFAKLGPRTGCKRLEFVIFFDTFDIFDIFDIAKLAKKSLNVEMSMIPPPPNLLTKCDLPYSPGFSFYLHVLKSKELNHPRYIMGLAD